MLLRRKSPPPPSPVRPPSRDPLAAVPLVPGTLDRAVDGRGLLHLRLRPQLRGMRKRVADLLGYDYSRRLELDACGTLYYQLIDGRRSLRDIAGEMAERGHGTPEQMETRVALFTKELMTRNMVWLKVETDAK